MRDINLIEYEPRLAKAVADMWRQSSKGWNGEFGNATEESVLSEMEGSTSLNTYLAEQNGEILGFCDFDQYLEDEGALYIALLNVRYDCHGKGIGKTLVCKAVERTVELNWPRLDLYTWPGNKKSIPLYKKCGFFLEKRDDATHLMNFIPYALQTEAVADMFKTLDWYKDKKRAIDLEPDGREENGFDFYEYLWEKDDLKLKMEFERCGRGLRLIETEDYIVKASLERQNFVFGQSYNICYEVLNKSGNPLEIEIKGIDNKNVKFDFHEIKSVKDQTKIYGEFYVGEIIEEINPFKTHPAVEAEILINGNKAVFKLGITPKRPAEISLKGTNTLPYECNSECYKDTESSIYLDLENNLDQKSDFSFSLAENSNIKFLNTDFNIVMNPKEKKSLKVTYILKNNFFYSENIEVTASLADGKKIKFNKALTCLFKGREGAFGGEGEDYFIIVNGPYSVKQSKLNNKAYVREYEDENAKTFFNVPKLGPSYTSEFYNIKPQKVTWYKDGDWMVLESTCVSEKYKNLEVTTVFKLAANGIVEHYHKIFNNSACEETENISLLQGTCQILTDGVLPLNNKFIKVSDYQFENIENFNLDNLTENWIFSKTSKITRGLCWNKNLKPKMADWFIGFEHNLGIISPHASVSTEPITLAFNTFKNWKDFRGYAAGDNSLNNMDVVEDLEVSVNNGNPFVYENFSVAIKEHKQQLLVGDFRVSSIKKSTTNTYTSLKAEDNSSETELKISRAKEETLDILNVGLNFPSFFTGRSSAIFHVGSTPMKEEVIQENGQTVYSLNNGLINIKASPSFSPALTSLVYKDHEWLESSYPEAKAKSWFNPWVGGLLNLPDSLGLRTIQDGKTEATFATLCDKCNNLWHGIKTSHVIQNNEQYNGLQICEYFLLLPGVPVLCHTTELFQNTGKHMCKEEFSSLNFFNVDKNIKNNYMISKNRNGEYIKYKAGEEAIEFRVDSSVFVGSKNLKEKLQIFTDFDKAVPLILLNTNDTACFINEKITAANGERIFTTPVFYILTDEIIGDAKFKDLKNIKF